MYVQLTVGIIETYLPYQVRKKFYWEFILLAQLKKQTSWSVILYSSGTEEKKGIRWGHA